MFNIYKNTSDQTKKTGNPFVSLFFLLLATSFAAMEASEPVAIGNAGKHISGAVSPKQIVNKLDKPSHGSSQTASPPPLIETYRSLVRTETWTEAWPDASGKLETRSVTAEVWTAAMQASLDETKALHIPAREQSYYLAGPLGLNSWCKLVAEPKAEIRLKPGSSSCMVRNTSIV